MAGRDIIVVDDGVATGATVKAGRRALRSSAPGRIAVATPVAPPDVVAELKRPADDVVCLVAARDFRAVGEHYKDFRQLSDQDESAAPARPLPVDRAQGGS